MDQKIDDSKTENSSKSKELVISLQKDEIARLLKKRLEKGDIWYLLDVRWFKQWKKYIGFDLEDQQDMERETAHPGPIDTLCFFKDWEKEILKDHLLEDVHYSLVPKEVWQKFVAWFGIKESSRPIPRCVLEYGLYVKYCKVEIYLLEFKLALHPEVYFFVTKQFSIAHTLGYLMNTIKQLYNIPEERECRLWHKYILSTYELLNKLEETIQDAGLCSGQLILLEPINYDGTWPRQPTIYAGVNMTTVRLRDPTDESKSQSTCSIKSSNSKPKSLKKKAASITLPIEEASDTLNDSAKYQPHRYQQHNKQMHESLQITMAPPVVPKIITQSQTVNQVNITSASVKLIDPEKTSGKLVQTKSTADNELNQESKNRNRSEEETKIKAQDVTDRDKDQGIAALAESLKQSQREFAAISQRLLLKEGELTVAMQDIIALQDRVQKIEKKADEEITMLANRLKQAEKETSQVNTTLHQNTTEANQKYTTLSQKLKLKENKWNIANLEIATMTEKLEQVKREVREANQENAALLQRLHQNKASADQENATLSERLRLKEEELAVLQERMHANETEQHERLQAQETQLQTFCSNALQQMRQQIETQMQQQMLQITNQMTMMQKVFNAVKPQWLVSRCEIALTQHELGNGGWGRVVKATFRNEQVAAKCLHHQIISEYNVQHFVREMQISAKCLHPNLLRFLGATLEGNPIILTELMDTNLYDVIRCHGLKDHQIISLLQDIVSAISYLHNLSPEPIIHRDISSSNVLLSGPVRSKWVVKLSDFGSANFLWHTSEQSRAPGNPTYAAPEVLSPHSHSEKMDVYSFGVLLFEICSGQAPSLQLRNEVLPTAAVVWPEPYHHFVPLIVSCTRDNKDERPTMSDVLAEL